MRPSHILKKIKTNTLPSRLVFFDTETKSTKLSDNESLQKLWFGYACYVRRLKGTDYSKPTWIRFTTQKAFWEWLIEISKGRTRVYVFAHNQSFDFTVMRGFSNLRRRGYKLRKAVIESPPTILTFKRDGRTLSFIDTLNYFRMSLKELGKAFGIDKLEMPEKDRSIVDWNTYCKRDVEILVKAILYYIQIVKDWKLGGFQYTIAAQGFAAFRHRFMDTQILIDDNEKALKLSRATYFGGRTECYHIGKLNGDMHLVDINSQYPFVMHNNLYPTKLLSVWNDVTLDEVDNLINKYSISCEAVIDTNEPIYPYVFNKRLVFPVGKFTTFLSTPEIIEAKARGHLVKINQAAIYNQSNIFKSYVDFFYRKRLEYIAEGNYAMAFLCKIILNSLYGKFGQSGYKYEETDTDCEDIIKTWDELDYETGKIYKYRQFAGIMQTQTRDAEAYNSFPAISAHVTAYARIYLYHLIETAKPHNVYYCDTDSLLINSEGLQLLTDYINEKELGALKVERHITYANIRAPKDYIFGDVEKIKGIRKNAEQIDVSTFKQSVFPGFKGMIQRGNLNDYIIKTVNKTLTRIYQKGTVSKDGGITPYQIETWR